MRNIEPNVKRIQRDIEKISEWISSAEPGYTRISFSEEDRRAREYLSQAMTDEAKLSVRIDAAGNLIGRKEGKREGPAILVGSHIDTVRGGGRFDGVSGVVAGIEIARRFEEEGIQIIHPLEVIIFLAEEPTPFGMSTIGSRAMAGKLSGDILASLKDNQGRTLGMAIDEMGGNQAKIGEAKRSRESVLAFLELHIEQGSVLFSSGIPIGVVTGIVGISRGTVEIVGRSDHAGTTPMTVRKDALAAGAEAVLALEKVCKELDGVVGTVGRMEVFPNALNVIPGKVLLGMEARSLSEDRLKVTSSLFKAELDRIAQRREVLINLDTGVSSNPVIFDSAMVERILRVCRRLGCSHIRIASGAGHDASHLAGVAPAGMILIPSRDGRSHCPGEWTEFEHIGLGAEVLLNTIIQLDREG